MAKPSVSFSIESVTLNGTEGDPPFGPDFAGTFVCHVPSLEESRATIPLRITGRAQRDGAMDAANVRLPAYLYIGARTWLDALSSSVPPWYEAIQKEEAEDDDKTFQAVLAAYRTLQEQLAARKKKRVETSAEASPPTSPIAATS